MDEIAAGLWHWTALNENIGAPVSSYYVEPIAAVLDPMEPEDGFGFFEGRNLDRVVLSNRHHYRHADRFAARFGIPVLGVEEGMHQIGERPGVESFAFGDHPAPDATVHQIEPSWPDEGAVHIALGPGILLLGDSAMHYGEDIGFVPDEHLGADPDREKALLRAGLSRLLDLDFDVLLFSHGSPIASGGKDALRAFVSGG
jgi:hypothetical protein